VYHTQKLFNPLNAELNPISHLLALLEAHHILHVSRIRVNTNLSSNCWAKGTSLILIQLSASKLPSAAHDIWLSSHKETTFTFPKNSFDPVWKSG
jgi:hypothetical protein